MTLHHTLPSGATACSGRREIAGGDGGSRSEGPDIAVVPANSRSRPLTCPHFGAVTACGCPQNRPAQRRIADSRGWTSRGVLQKDMRHLRQPSRYASGPCPLPARRAYGRAVGSDDKPGEVVRFPRRHVDGELWEPWVDEQALARHFSVSTRTVRRWRAMGMPSRLIGGVRRYRIGEAERWHHEQGDST